MARAASCEHRAPRRLVAFLAAMSSVHGGRGFSVRLFGQDAPLAGRLEIYHNGEWGQVCDTGFDDVDAQVVCRQLGHLGGTARPNAAYGQGRGEIWLKDVQCNGSESTLSECAFNLGQHETSNDCPHTDDVGVDCDPTTTTTRSTTSASNTTFTEITMTTATSTTVTSVSSTSSSVTTTVTTSTVSVVSATATSVTTTTRSATTGTTATSVTTTITASSGTNVTTTTVTTTTATTTTSASTSATATTTGSATTGTTATSVTTTTTDSSGTTVTTTTVTTTTVTTTTSATATSATTSATSATTATGTSSSATTATAPPTHAPSTAPTDAPTLAPTAEPTSPYQEGQTLMLRQEIRASDFNASNESEHDGSFPQAIVVPVPNSSITVRFPVSMFEFLGVGEIDVSILDVFVPVLPETSAGGDAPVEVLSSVAIDVLLANVTLRVQGLPEPIIFSLPVNESNVSDGEVQCAFLDETAGQWSRDGVYIYGYGEDGNLLCATHHLSIFAAFFQGFAAALQCSQASLLTEESYVELLDPQWLQGLGSKLLLALLGLLAVLMGVACALDERERRRGEWRTEFFLVAESQPPAEFVDVATAGACCVLGCPEGCIDGLVASSKDAIDDVLSSLWAHLALVRDAFLEVWGESGSICSSGGGGFLAAVMGTTLWRSALRNSAAVSFLCREDVELLLSDELAQELEEDEEKRRSAQVCSSDVADQPLEPETVAAVAPLDEQSPEAGGGCADPENAVADSHGRVRPEIFKLMRKVISDGSMPEAPDDQASASLQGKEKPAGEMDCSRTSTKEEAAGPKDAEVGVEATEAVVEIDKDMDFPEAPTLAALRTTSDLDAMRYRHLRDLRAHLLELTQKSTRSHSNCCYALKGMMLSWLSAGPVGSVFSYSILMSHSMRALLLFCDLIGSLLLATFFVSATGGSLSKRSSKACKQDCNSYDATCTAMHMGRLVAIGLVSSVLSGVPLAVISSLHQREFVRVPWQGSLEWHQQLRWWRRRDALVWLLGLAYLAFAINFIILFFANVADVDQMDWMVSAAVGFLEDIVVLPAAIGLLVTAAAVLSVLVASWKYGLRRHQLVRSGSAKHIKDVIQSSASRLEAKQAFSSNFLSAWIGEHGPASPTSGGGSSPATGGDGQASPSKGDGESSKEGRSDTHDPERQQPSVKELDFVV